MTEANESQGLKIAVSALISLSVILLVAIYFLYSAQSAAQVKLEAAEAQARNLTKSQAMLQAKYDDLKAQLNKVSDARPK